MMSESFTWAALRGAAVLALCLALTACGDERAGAGPAPSDASPPAAPLAGAPVAGPSAAGPNQAPAGADAADAALAAKVKSALTADRDVNAVEIDVVAARGVVILYGTAATHVSRDRAARVAAGIEGVKSVTNKLAVVAGS